MFDSANPTGGYCYRDFEDQKIRVICINTNESDDGIMTVSAKQNTWLASALDLSSKGKGWWSVLLSHHPLDWLGSSTNVMQTIKAASGILCAFHGHVHGYKVDKITGTEIYRIAVPNACYQRNNEYGTNGKAENTEGVEFGETTTYYKTLDSAKDTAFCVITIDPVKGYAYADHYGAGPSESRIVKLDVSAYANLVPKATVVNGTAIYNGKGYKDGYRISSAISESAASGYVMTGVMPFAEKADGTRPVIYIKGVTLDTTDKNCRWSGLPYLVNATASNCIQLNGGSTTTANMLSTYFTIETLGTNYYKLTPIESAFDNWSGSPIGCMMMSMKGSGANLIVTTDEPIE